MGVGSGWAVFTTWQPANPRLNPALIASKMVLKNNGLILLFLNI